MNLSKESDRGSRALESGKVLLQELNGCPFPLVVFKAPRPSIGCRIAVNPRFRSFTQLSKCCGLSAGLGAGKCELQAQKKITIKMSSLSVTMLRKGSPSCA